MNAIFIVFYIASFVYYYTLDYMKLLHILQLNGYVIKPIFLNFKELFLKNILYEIFYLIIFILLIDIEIKNIFILIFIGVCICVFFYILSPGFGHIKKIKYTKRMLRLIILSIILLVITCYVSYRIITYKYMVLLMPLLWAFGYLVFATSVLLLSPIERAIYNKYIRKAKLKLSSLKNLKKIGITGSFGKTSTKEILLKILEEQFVTVATPKSFNTPMGLTRTILDDELDEKTEVLVTEMGAKNVGEIKELCELVDIKYGILTAIGRQHTSTFGKLENIIKTKKELPDYLAHDSCVFNLMNNHVKNIYMEYVGDKIGVALCHRCKTLYKQVLKTKNRLSKSKTNNISVLHDFPPHNTITARNIEESVEGSNFDVWHGNEKLFGTTIQILGKHNIINTLLAIACAIMLGETCPNIEVGLRKIKPIKARLEKMKSAGGATVLNNGYNSNIDSVGSALEVLSLYQDKNKIVVTPGLIETINAYDTNKRFGERLASVANEVIIVKKLNRNAIYYGLLAANFDMTRVKIVDSFAEAKEMIDKMGEDNVILIENDLPENYK